MICEKVVWSKTECVWVWGRRYRHKKRVRPKVHQTGLAVGRWAIAFACIPRNPPCFIYNHHLPSLILPTLCSKWQNKQGAENHLLLFLFVNYWSLQQSFGPFFFSVAYFYSEWWMYTSVGLGRNGPLIMHLAGWLLLVFSWCITCITF